jgi:hypothetical protein
MTTNDNIASLPECHDRRKGTTKLVLPGASQNPNATRSFMLEYLVPLLAAEFLRQRNNSMQTNNTVDEKLTSQSLSRKVGR